MDKSISSLISIIFSSSNDIETAKNKIISEMSEISELKEAKSKDIFISLFLKKLRYAYQIEINKLLSSDTYSSFGPYFTQMSIWLSEQNIIDFASSLILIEDIFETFPIKEIESLFELVSAFLKKVDQKIIDEKKYKILKITNTVMKRLSPSLDTKLRGEIQMLLSEIFPISDKSGVNLKGHYNMNNSASWNEIENDIISNKSNIINVKFYKQFWILHKYLTNPFLLFTSNDNENDIEMLSNEDLMEIDNAPRNNNTKLDIFLANINYIVDFFDKNEIDKENSNCNIAIQSCPGYLTNSELFNLELNDSSFRKTILIQFIIVLSSFIKPISQNQKKIFVFPKSITEKITNELNHCVTVLKKSNQKVLNILNDETVWEKWKENGCSTPFEKFPDENLKKLFNDTNTKFSKRKKIVVDGCPLNNLFNFEKEFNIDMNDIYNININFEIESIFNQVPFIGTFVEKVLSDADPTLEIEEKQRIINLDKSFSWKFLRLLSHNDITRLNNDKNSKVISICEDYFNKYKTKEVSNLTLFPQPAPAPPAPPKEKIVVNTNNLPPISNNSSTTNNTTVVITTTTEKKQITAVPSAHKEKEKISISKEDNKHDNSNHSNGRDKDKNRDHYLHKKRSADRNNTQSSNKKHKF